MIANVTCECGHAFVLNKDDGFDAKVVFTASNRLRSMHSIRFCPTCGKSIEDMCDTLAG